MKKLLFIRGMLCIVFALFTVLSVSAQEKKKPGGFMNRTGDHLMLQLTSDYWMGNVPDSISNRINGFARGANVYVMLDQRFKSAPQWSVAFGVGLGTSNIYFRNMVVDVKAKTNTLPFTVVDSVDHFKKYKLTTAFLEVPLELRYTVHPERESKSIKAALGVKVGTILNVHTKGKKLVDKNEAGLNGYTEKETAKGYFNSTRLAATFRIGYGNFSLFGCYQLNNILKDGVGPDMKLFQVGLNFSGL